MQKLIETIANNNEIEVIGLVSSTKDVVIRKIEKPMRNVHYLDLNEFCLKNKISYAEVSTIDSNEKLSKVLLKWNPDIVFVAGWHRLIPSKFLETWKFYGFHASLLPKNAGWAPLVWAMLKGEEKTGVSLFQIDSGVDTGPIIDRVEFPILNTTTIGDLVNTSIDASVNLMSRNILAICAGNPPLTPQDNLLRTEGRRRFPIDGLINWDTPKAQVERFIRAQSSPYFGSFTILEEKRLKIFSAEIVTKFNSFLMESREQPGRLISLRGDIFVGCSDGWIRLVDYKFEENHPMS